MSQKVSPIFPIFETQHAEAKAIFFELIKQMKSKKAIELLGKVSFLELFSELMTSVHSENQIVQEDIFAPFRPLQKNLRKIYHFKLVEESLHERSNLIGKNYNKFGRQLASYKKELYNSTYEMIVGSTLEHWDQFHAMALESSKSLKPLMLNSGVNKVMQLDLEQFHLDQAGTLGTLKLREIYHGLRRIIILENILVQVGFNSIFTPETHQEIDELKGQLKIWYKTHLTLQSLTYFISNQPKPTAKYVAWLKDLTQERKSLSLKAEEQAKSLFDKLLV